MEGKVILIMMMMMISRDDDDDNKIGAYLLVLRKNRRNEILVCESFLFGHMMLILKRNKHTFLSA